MNMMQTVKIVSLAAALGLGATALWAKGPDRAAIFSKIDADGNGELTQAELQAHAGARLAAADTDGDGFLSNAELLNARGGDRAEKMLKRFDTNSDGVLDAGELEAAANNRIAKRAQRMMARLDTNEDGKIAVAEALAGRDQAKLVERLDADGNGTLSQEEFAKRRQ
jgi:Ca2+-binding EF-hand superfamily protein